MQMDFDVTSISAVVAAAGVLVGVVYYILDMRNQSRIRKTDLLMRLYSTGTSREYLDALYKMMNLQVRDYQDYVRQYGLILTENPMNTAFITISTYYDLVGTLLYRRLIDIVTVYDIWGASTPKTLYEKIKPIVLGIRRELNEPAALCGFEYLYDELTGKESQLKKTWGKYASRTSLEDFVDSKNQRKENK